MFELLMVAASLCWAAGFVLVRGAIAGAAAVQVAAVRFLAAGLVFIGIAAFTGRIAQIPAIPWNNLVLIAGGVLLGASAGDVLLMNSIRRIGVARAYAISYAYPLLAVVIAVIFLGETLSVAAAVGVVVVVVGCVLASFEPAKQAQANGRAETTDGGRNAQTDSQQTMRRLFRASRRLESLRPRTIGRVAMPTGVALALAAAALWGLSTNLTKAGVAGIDPLTVNAVRMPLAAIVTTTVAALTARQSPFGRMSPRIVGISALSGLIGLTLGSAIYIAVLPEVGAARGSALAAPSPVFALILSMIFLGERPGWRAIAGIPVTALGVALLTVR